MTVHDAPRVALLFRVGELDIVRNDLQLASFLLNNQVRKNGADDGCHTRRHHDNGDMVCFGECVELLEARIKLDVSARQLFHFFKGPMDRLKHLTKSVTEAYLFRHNRIVDLTTFRVAHAHSVDHVIIRIKQRDRAVEIRQKYILRIAVLGRRHG